MCPVVINDGQDQYEGLGLLINTTANFATMTLDEAEYLLDLLRSVDMHTLSMQVINSAMLLKDVETRKIVKPETLPATVEPIEDRRILPNKGEGLLYRDKTSLFEKAGKIHCKGKLKKFSALP